MSVLDWDGDLRQCPGQTGSIVGAVSDESGAVLPGVLVTLGGDRLIGGAQTATTDTNGSYRFDRLPPGDFNVRFELQGFKSVERAAIRVNAAFTATVNARLEVGSLNETITVTGESPTVDLNPREILSPRIIRIGFSLDF